MQLLTPFRGVAALWVVLFHWTPHLPHLGDPSAPWHHLFASGYLWVDFFFVLSGFVLAHVYGFLGLRGPAVRSYLWARFTRIYPLHLAVLLLLVGIELAKLAADAEAFAPPGRSLGALFLQLTLLNALGLDEDLSWNRPAWSIGAEWMAYLAFPLLMIVVRRTSARVAVGLALLLLAGSTTLSWVHGDLDAAHDLGALRCVLEFSLGLLAYRLLHAPDRLGEVGDGPVLALLLATVALLAQPPGPWRDAAVVPLFVALVTTLASATGRRSVGVLGSAWARRVGDASYAIYMIHALAHPLLRRLHPRLARWTSGWSDPVALLGEAVLLVVGTFVLIAVSDQVFRRFEDPVKRSLRRWRGAR